MILDLFRLFLLIILIVAIFIDIDIPNVLTIQINQLLIAILIIFIIVVFDEIIGFLLGIIFLVIYFKHYQKIINNSSNTNKDLKEPLIKAYTPFGMDNYNNIDNFIGDIKPQKKSNTENIKEHYVSLNEENNSIIMPYISEELLDKAQNNIYDEKNYYTEIKKIENGYGIQGLNSDEVHYMAFDNKNELDNLKYLK